MPESFGDRLKMNKNPLVEIKSLVKSFGQSRSLVGRKKPVVQAVRGVDLTINRGDTLGIVGESGCGKSTLARMLVGLDSPTSGKVLFDGQCLAYLKKKDRHAVSQKIQFVFQDPLSSLNPRHTIEEILRAPLKYLRRINSQEQSEALDRLMAVVGLRSEFLPRYPHEFSGGQAQRIAIARALAAQPELLVLDEPVSALDVSIQAQVLNLLMELKQQYQLTYVFISHDLAVVENISDMVAVMYLGKIIEQGDTAALFKYPRHHYTKLLLSSVPELGKKVAGKPGDAIVLPDPLNPPPGCAFAERCHAAQERCFAEPPGLQSETPGNAFACFYPLNRTT
jgi:peptide/nickel transport system ATP-binding protein